MVNTVILIGNLGKDPEVRFTGNGKAVCKFPLATEESWQDGQGERQKHTEWHNVIVWGKTGEACGKHLEKGSKVYLQGRIRSRSYDDKDGNRRYVTEIIGDQVRFLSFKAKDQEQRGNGNNGGGQASEDDISW